MGVGQDSGSAAEGCKATALDLAGNDYTDSNFITNWAEYNKPAVHSLCLNRVMRRWAERNIHYTGKFQ